MRMLQRDTAGESAGCLGAAAPATPGHRAPPTPIGQCSWWEARASPRRPPHRSSQNLPGGRPPRLGLPARAAGGARRCPVPWSPILAVSNDSAPCAPGRCVFCDRAPLVCVCQSCDPAAPLRARFARTDGPACRRGRIGAPVSPKSLSRGRVGGSGLVGSPLLTLRPSATPRRCSTFRWRHACSRLYDGHKTY